jgi:SOS-response transcriptional repressor LexA
MILLRESFSARALAPKRLSPGDKVADLDQLKPKAMLAAPKDWCPNPASTISLVVKGHSMSPLILDGYLIAVDTSDVSHDDLVGKIVVAWNQEKRVAGFTVDSITPTCWSRIIGSTCRSQ